VLDSKIGLETEHILFLSISHGFTVHKSSRLNHFGNLLYLMFVNNPNLSKLKVSLLNKNNNIIKYLINDQILEIKIISQYNN